MSWISDNTTQTLAAALDLRALRQNLLTANIANADTPHYQPVDLTFSGALGSALGSLNDVIAAENATPDVLATDNPAHLTTSEAGGLSLTQAEQVVVRPDVTDSLDGNGVNLDQQLARLAGNAARFNATAEAARRRFAIENYVIARMTTA